MPFGVLRQHARGGMLLHQAGAAALLSGGRFVGASAKADEVIHHYNGIVQRMKPSPHTLRRSYTAIKDLR